MTEAIAQNLSKLSASDQSATSLGPTSEELLISLASQVSEVQNQLDFAHEQSARLSNQNAYIIDMLTKAQGRHSSMTVTTVNSPKLASLLSGHHIKYEVRYTPVALNQPAAVVVSTSSIPLHKALEFGSLLLFFVCTAGLASWIVSDVPLVNPFAAVLGLLSSPFFYLMGRVARR